MLTRPLFSPSLLAGIASFLSTTALSQLANSPPVPQWVVAAKQATAVEKRFEWSGKLLKAILLAAADGKAEIALNGKAVGSIEGKEKATSLDVTRFVREGANTLSLRSASPVAALLELNGNLANTRWIATEGSWNSGGAQVVVRGAVDADPNANPFDLKKTFDAYNSWQLAKPGNQNQATDPTTFIVPPGFKVELIRSAQPDEDSWVSMTFDPKGRITIGKEKKGLMRLKVARASSSQPFEVRDGSLLHFADSLLECRGLLYAHGALYANANNSKGLFRLRDLDGDDQFEDITELLRTEGGVGHGRNHIKLGPDGKIYIAHGNNVLLPTNISPRSPLKNYGHDQLIPNPWDGTMFDGNVELPAGHILRMNPDGSEVELLAGGFRNPLDIAFNREGELFTFDADMERDVGTPWYMPTRVLHVVPGADFGWRRGTGRFPAWYIDTLPSVIDIGLASPTATFFGYGARFPKKYQEAYFIMDWAYGRIIAVHLKVHGASYTGEQETFISGRPLNVTDGCIGPDGAMWFITGGRGTQSGLYRVSYAGSIKSETADSDNVNDHHKLRLELERMAAHPPAAGDQAAWSKAFVLMGSDDWFVSHAARQVMEEIPPESWGDEALNGTTGMPAIVRCLALVRIGDKASRNGILTRLNTISFASLKPFEQLCLLRVLGLTFARLAEPSESERLEWLRQLEPKYPQAQSAPHPNPLHGVGERESDAGARKPLPAKSKPDAGAKKWLPLPAREGRGVGGASEVQHLNWELCRLLVYLKSPTVIEKTLPLLRKATASEDLLFFPFILRYLKGGWSLEARRVCFEALNRAEKLNGASAYFKAIADTRSELAAALTAGEARQLADVIYPPKPAALSAHALPGHTFKNWTLADLASKLELVSKGRSFEKAKAALVTTQCVFCHRVSSDPSLPAGIFGPDLTQVSARFNRHDLLMHILEPSKFIDEKFRFVTVTTTDGRTVTGNLESEDDERLVLKPNPLAAQTEEIAKAMVKERKVSDISPMPPGLLNTLKAEQILDILAWFEAGGDPKHAVFQ